MTRAPAYGLALIVLSNALPLLGVLLGGWDVLALLIFYWLETAIVLFWTLLTIVFWRSPTGRRNPSDTLSRRLFVALFILLNAGIFMLVHLMLMGALFGRDGTGDTFSLPGIVSAFVVGQALWPALLAMFGYRYLVFRDERHDPTPLPAIAGLYARIFVMQTVIMLGGWAMLAVGAVGGLVILVALRTALDFGWLPLREVIERHAPAGFELNAGGGNRIKSGE